MFLYHKAVNVRSENTSSLCITHDSKLASRDFSNISVDSHTGQRRGRWDEELGAKEGL